MMTFIKRRLSVDQSGESNENETNLNQRQPENMTYPDNIRPVVNRTSIQQTTQSHQAIPQLRTTSGSSPSAPSSPTKTISISAMFSTAKDIVTSNATAVTSSLSNVAQQNLVGGHGVSFLRQSALNKEKNKLLLVIDDSNVVWARYFRNKKLNGDQEIRVEQAEFKNINLAAYSDSGLMVDLLIEKDGIKVIRSFKPDFILIRQNVKDPSQDWKDVIIGLQFGCIPCVNSLSSVYNFRDRPWVFAQLIQLQRKFGQEAFPLINQTYCANYKEMIRTTFPCVVKIGHAHHGAGKIKVENSLDFQEIVSIVSISNQYATIEPFIETKCDIQIQKIGENYKAYMRRTINGNWKANTGSAMLEQIPVTAVYKFWIDEVSKMFGGLDICAVQVIVEQSTGKEYIIDACDCALNLLGESQEGDRRIIADLVWEKMTKLGQSVPIHSSSSLDIEKNISSSSTQNQAVQPQHSRTLSVDKSYVVPKRQQPANPTSIQTSEQTNLSYIRESMTTKPNFLSTPPIQPLSINQPQNVNQIGSIQQSSSSQQKVQPSVPLQPNNNKQQQQPSLVRSQTSNATPNRPPPIAANFRSQNINNRPNLPNQLKILNNNVAGVGSDESEDTMNNLRKTFAGIFGNSNMV